MSFILTTESLQDISVKCVTAFITKQASLSESISNEAKNLELNPDQIKRVIETSNTLAYLRMQKEASDRTFEFPVADYNKVMSNMTMPTDTSYTSPELTKVASVEKAISTPEYSGISFLEKRALLIKEALSCRENLTKMAEVKEMLKQKLEKEASILSKDFLGLEKLAQVVEEEDFPKMLHLCRLEKRAEVNSVFTDNDLNSARKVYSLYKEAKDLLSKEASMELFVKKAEKILFEKEAGFDPIGSIAEGVSRGAGWAAGKTVSGVGNAIGSIRPFEFSSEGRRQGFKNTDKAVKAFDKIKNTQGESAAKAAFRGSKPSLLLHRIGAGKIMSASAGLGISHKNNVWKDLQE